jgi:hypothetical protein
MRNTGKPLKEGTENKTKPRPGEQLELFGDTNHEEAFNPTR